MERVLTSREGLRVDGEVDGWLARSRVGEVRYVGMVETLKDAFLVEGLVAANLRYFGGGLVLISAPENEDLEAILRGIGSGSTRPFDTLSLGVRNHLCMRR